METSSGFRSRGVRAPLYSLKAVATKLMDWARVHRHDADQARMRSTVNTRLCCYRRTCFELPTASSMSFCSTSRPSATSQPSTFRLPAFCAAIQTYHHPTTSVRTDVALIERGKTLDPMVPRIRGTSVFMLSMCSFSSHLCRLCMLI